MIVPRYIPVSYVQTRLYNKVNFLGTTSLINPNFADSDNYVGLSNDQTAVFINQAASFVEFELSPLYIVPFKTKLGINYDSLNIAMTITTDTSLLISQIPIGTTIDIFNIGQTPVKLYPPTGYTFQNFPIVGDIDIISEFSEFILSESGENIITDVGDEIILKPRDIINVTNIGNNILYVNIYDSIPASTQDFLNNLIINRSCALILQTEFAKDTGVKGENFIKQLDDQWREYIDNRLLKRSEEGKYQYPPLANLATNGDQYDLSAPMSGPVTVKVGEYDGLGYANRHINDPARKLWYPFSYWGGWGV